MPSRKQRRRRAKDRRHEYEYVYVDEEGEEVEPPPEEAVKPRNGKAPAKAVKASKASAKASPWSRPGARPVPPPSWQRVAKRGALFAPLMFITISLLGRHLTIASRIIQTAYLMLLFIPFSYLVDRTMYRRYLKVTGQLPQTPPKRGRQS